MPSQVYKPALAQGPWDAVVIGSGIGGLASAALLAQAGRRVLVLERHYVAGGFTHTFDRKGYRWDVGIHYVGEMQRRNSVMKRVCDAVSEGRLRWAPMPEIYDRAVFLGEGPDEVYDFVAGRENLKSKLKDYFPGEATAIDRYFDLVDQVARSARGYFMEKALPPAAAVLASPFLRRRFLKLSDKTTWEVISQLTRNEKLIGVLTTQYGDYGLPPKRSSFAIHAIVARHYFEGGSYPAGGSESIAESIFPTIEAAGGKVLIKAEVKEVLIDKGRAAGVLMTNGDRIEAKTVVSDAGVFNTFGRLLPADVADGLGLRKKLTQVSHSLAHACLYMGLKGTAAEHGLPKANFWLYPGYDHDASIDRYVADPEAPLPVTYISFPSAKDPDWDANHPGIATMEAVAFVPYERFQKWEDTRWMKRGPDYEALKARLSERLLENVYRMVPQVRGKIDHQELSTPLSTRHFANYENGEIYGLDHTPARFRLKWLKPRTPVDGLFLTGQDIVSVGFGGALMGGVLAASAVLGKNVLSGILKK
ncbi:MAG TPA: NAD(P)/FAD-dependent oxidoreductase [bacterium]|nr:NAD(P)/FAD-dependent oxidoreductase [bacterium]